MKHGFRVMDSDLHTMEPDTLWERYLEAPFRAFAPAFVRRTENAPNQPIIRVGDLEIGEMSKRPQTAVVGKDLQRRAFARHPHYEIAHARGYDPEAHVAAMEIEGIDVAIIYGTRGRQVLMHDDLEPEVAAALARAHNNWTRDFCAWNPDRLKFAAQVAFHDVPLAVTEATRAVRELGAVAVIGNPNPVRGRHIHDPEFGPLSEVQISQLPSQYFFRQCYVATDAGEKVLKQVVEAVGDDTIVVSTDYPHSDGLFPRAMEEFVALEGVSDKTKAKILWDNCARLYNLTGIK